MSWATARLDQLCDIQIGRTPARADKRFWDGGTHPWASISDISRDRELTSTKESITEKALSVTKIKIAAAGTVLMSFKLSIGKVAIARIDTCTNEAIAALHVKDPRKLDRDYLARALESLNFQDAGDRAAKGKTLNKKSLAKLEIPFPPLNEQKRIAAILDQADELRRKRKRAIDRLNQLGQAIFHEMFGDPATNPKGFHALPLGEAIEFVGGAQPAKSHFLYEDGPDRVRFVQIRDFRTDKYPTYVPKALAKRPFSKEDVMIGRYGPPVFQIFRGLSGTYNVALMKARPRGHLTSDFIFFLLQEPKLHSFVVANSERTAGQSGVNLDLLERYPAYAPPAELLTEFSERIADLNVQTQACGQAAIQTNNLFESLQHRAFRGEL